MKKFVFSVIALLLFYTRAYATPLSDLIASMSNNTWAVVANSRLDTQMNAISPKANCGPINITAFSGGAWDTTRNRLLIFGGGHGDYCGNEIWAFTDQLTWSRLTVPSVSDPNDVVSGVAQPYYADGKPRSRHTYGGIDYISNGDRLCTFNAVAMWSGALGGALNVDCFNFGSSNWQRMADNNGNGNNLISVYNPVTNVLWKFRDFLESWNPVTNSWSIRGSSDNLMSGIIWRSGAIDTTRNKLVITGGQTDNNVYTWDLNTGGTISRVNQATTNAPSSITNCASPGFQYAPTMDKFVAWCGTNTVWTLDPVTWAWASIVGGGVTAPPDNNIPVGSGVFGRWRWMPALGAFILQNGIDKDIYIFKTTGVGTPDVTPPTDPASLSATPISSTQINLTWNASTDAVGVTGYNVERCQGAACVNFVEVYTPSGNSQADTGRTASTLYRYRVRAHDGAGNLSGYSNIAQATTLAPDIIAPSIPANLVATPVSGTQVNLSWNASTDNVAVTGYNLERCQGAACVSFVEVFTPSGTSQSDPGRTQLTLYRYRVRAHDAANNLSGYSSIAEATTLTGGSVAVGNLTHDGPATPEQLSLFVNLTGTVALTATATVRYKVFGTGTWLTGHPLYRIRPTLTTTPESFSVVDGFAWPIIDLTPGTSYDVEVTFTEGTNSSVLTNTFTTAALPGAAGTANKTVSPFANLTAIQVVLDGLNPGDVFELPAGTYTIPAGGGVQANVTRSGTSNSPIYIRGASKTGTIINSISGRGFVFADGVSNVVLENMTINCDGIDTGTNSDTMPVTFANDGTMSRLTFRDLVSTGCDRAIGPSGYTAAFTIQQVFAYNNTFTGNNVWTADNYGPNGGGGTYSPDGIPDIDTNVFWNDDGINLAGLGNAAWNNTMIGYGDTFAYSSGGSSPNQATRGVHYYRNDIRNSGDDCTEVDHAFRNNSFYDNRCTNSMTFLSLDPVYGGPFLFARNISINVGRQPFKWNSQQSGMFLYNNTIIHTTTQLLATLGASAEAGWYQSGNNGDQESFGYRNNIMVYFGSGTQMTRMDACCLTIVDLDHNSWGPDLIFNWFSGSGANLATAQANSPTVTPVFSGLTTRQQFDNITAVQPWTVPITLGANYHTEATGTYTPTLAAATAPKNSGIAIPNITDGFSGAAPDRGAIIAGRAAVTYGVGGGSVPVVKIPVTFRIQ